MSTFYECVLYKDIIRRFCSGSGLRRAQSSRFPAAKKFSPSNRNRGWKAAPTTQKSPNLITFVFISAVLHNSYKIS
jgi:hypothetical protein